MTYRLISLNTKPIGFIKNLEAAASDSARD
jgi:hypothetical protein